MATENNRKEQPEGQNPRFWRTKVKAIPTAMSSDQQLQWPKIVLPARAGHPALSAQENLISATGQ